MKVKPAKGVTLTSETERVAKCALRKYARERAPYAQQRYYRLATEIDAMLGMRSGGPSKEKVTLNLHETTMLYSALAYCGESHHYQGTVTAQQYRELCYVLFRTGHFTGR